MNISRFCSENSQGIKKNIKKTLYKQNINSIDMVRTMGPLAGCCSTYQVCWGIYKDSSISSGFFGLCHVGSMSPVWWTVIGEDFLCEDLSVKSSKACLQPSAGIRVSLCSVYFCCAKKPLQLA